MCWENRSCSAARGLSVYEGNVIAGNKMEHQFINFKLHQKLAVARSEGI